MTYSPSQIQAIYFEYSPGEFSPLYTGQEAQEKYQDYLDCIGPDCIANIFYDIDKYKKYTWKNLVIRLYMVYIIFKLYFSKRR